MNRMCTVAALLLLCGVAIAEDATGPATPSELPIGSIAEFQALKYEALRLQAGMVGSHRQELEFRTLYIGSAAPLLKVRHIAVSIDDRNLSDQDVDDRPFHTLDGAACLLRLDGAVISEGRHSVHVQFAYDEPSSTGPQQKVAVLDDTFDVTPGVTGVSFSLQPSTLLSGPAIAVRRYHPELTKTGLAVRTAHEIGRFWGSDGNYIRGEFSDPAVGYAEYLRRSGRGEEAAIELLALADGQPEHMLPAQFWLRLAAVLREVGLWNHSLSICDRLDASRQDSKAVVVERLNIALKEYDNGNIDRAETQLRALKGRVPDDRLQDWQLAYAQILFLRQQNAEAESVLHDRDDDDTQAFRYMSQSDEAILTTTFRHYNLAVAMVRNGAEQKGLSLLDLIGRLKTRDSDLIAVRDQANLSLGWYFLRKRQGITAMGALGRVGTEGRFSQSALLGMGWAQLAPAGEKLKRVRLDRDAKSNFNSLPAPAKHSLTQLGVFDPELDASGGPARFEFGDPPKDRQQGLQRALLFWNELSKRDARNPAVQEGLLAVAYAHQGLQESTDARQAYDAAIAALQAQRKSLLDEVAAIRAAGPSRLAEEREGDGSREGLLASGNLQPSEQNQPIFGAIRRYRELAAMQHVLADLAEQADTQSATDSSGQPLSPRLLALKARVVAALQTELDGIDALATKDLMRQADLVGRYLSSAYFSSARASDQPVNQEQP